MNGKPNFDPIARPYRLLEYLTFGPILQGCRTYHLPALLHQRRALVLGDGDGRFLAQLLTANPEIQVEAVDLSRTMLDLLETRCEAASPTAAARLRTHHTDALSFTRKLLPAKRFDLVVTHFFLDCLTQSELQTLVEALAPHLAPNALWLLSDFRIPSRGPIRLLARAAVRSLYLAFRFLTGLRVTHLPDHKTVLDAANLTPVRHHRRLAGLLTTELWQASAANQ